MRDEIKAARLAALFGLPEEVVPKKPTAAQQEARDDVSREAEAAIAYLTTPTGFVQRECRNCGHIFAVNRANISLCSDSCREHYLLSVYGLEVDLKARTPQERWAQNTGGPEPLIVAPPTLAVLPVPDQQQEVSA